MTKAQTDGHGDAMTIDQRGPKGQAGDFFKMLYYPTFFIHKKFGMDLTNMWEKFMLKYLVLIIRKIDRVEEQPF